MAGALGNGPREAMGDEVDLVRLSKRKAVEEDSEVAAEGEVARYLHAVRRGTNANANARRPPRARPPPPAPARARPAASGAPSRSLPLVYRLTLSRSPLPSQRQLKTVRLAGGATRFELNMPEDS